MLEPDSRVLMREVLRPPAGFRFDRMIGTSFSLDLTAILLMPVAFSLFNVPDDDDQSPDPLALLQSIRQYAGRMHVFCQAGRISVPKRHHLLFAHLEESIIEVTPPREEGVFHPKLTVLRFVGDGQGSSEGRADGDSGPVVHYRLLCGSRNLTFDRSWDTMAVLEGKVASRRRRAFSRNRPLGRFIEALPDLAVRGAGAAAADACREAADELLRVEFEMSNGFDEYAFWPMGLSRGTAWPFPQEMERLLVVSPFLADGMLDRLKATRRTPVLISRPEALDELAEDTINLFDPYVLHPAAEEIARPLDEPEEGDPDAPPLCENGTLNELTGLHAKLYVADCGGRTRVWTGSANATQAAFSGNVEFLLELREPRHRFGVDKLLPPERDDDATLHFDNLLEKYRRPDDPTEADPSAREAERLAEEARRRIVRSGLALFVGTAGYDPNERQYRLVLRRDAAEARMTLPEGVTGNCRPLRLPERQAVPLDDVLSESGARFDPVSFAAISAFVAFRLQARCGKARHEVSFVLNLPLRGVPEDREQRLLIALLANREQLLRFLLMLLAEDEHDLRSMMQDLDSGGSGESENDSSHEGTGLPLLEPLLRALEHDPERLDQIARLVEDLSSHEEGRRLLPEGFVEVWRPILEARKELMP